MKEAFVSLTAVKKTMGAGRRLHPEAQDAGLPMTCTAEPAKHGPRED
jgi:hypothetical protein